MQSMPQLRPSNVQSPAPVQNLQALQKPQGPLRPPNNGIQVPPTNRMPPPQTTNNPHRPENPAVPPVQNHTQNPAIHSNNSSAGTTTDSPQQQRPPTRHGPVPNSNNGEESDNANGAQAPRNPPPGIPEGFVTGRSAELLNQPPSARPPNTALAFNPHADSPSIRRTHGVNPGKSMPITRQALASTQSASGATVANAITGHSAAQVDPAAPPQLQARVNNGNGLNGNTNPIRTNFVNPSADTNRRIGMPPSAAAHAMHNRGAYKPPTAANANPLKRPPLSDVSNLQAQVDGSDDVKKAKVDGGEVPAVRTESDIVAAGAEPGTR